MKTGRPARWWLPCLAALVASTLVGCHGGDCPVQVTGDVSDRAEEALARANDYRALMGLAPGTLDSTLNDAAQAHANWMYDEGAISH